MPQEDEAIGKQRRAADYRRKLTVRAYKLPKGARHAYVVHRADDNYASIQAMSFDMEALIALAVDHGSCSERGWGRFPNLARIAVIEIDGKWHKISILPIANHLRIQTTEQTQQTQPETTPPQ